MGNFKFIETGIADLYEVQPMVFGDERGYFMETYNISDFENAGIFARFVQDNHSRSVRGVLRGMHFQKKYPQGKLVRVVRGEVYDVAVDIRNGSPTYGNWHGVYLSEENKRMLYVPPGFAHGFLVTGEYAEFVYRCTELYHPEDEDGIAWDDKTVAIDWPLHLVEKLILSDKDRTYPGLADIKS